MKDETKDGQLLLIGKVYSDDMFRGRNNNLVVAKIKINRESRANRLLVQLFTHQAILGKRSTPCDFCHKQPMT